jgi:lipopolysaccharide biosynthesis glycosyltransferase
MNFIYCLDKNYNTQAIMSFYTLNKFVKETINVYVVHNKPETLIEELKNFNFNNVNFKFLKFENEVDLPNLENSHVTEATYYRIFAINLLDKEIEDIIYVDSDILFNKNPTNEFKKCLEVLKSSDFTISASTIGRYKKVDEETDRYFEYLGMDDKYFNAGVIVYDLIKYHKKNLSAKLEQHLFSFNKEARYWDQDIMNSFFNGKYLELDKSLNNSVALEDTKLNLEKVLENSTVHFAGKTKPWHVAGMKSPLGNHFQDIYLEVFKKKYFISPFNKIRHLKELFDFIVNKKDYLVENRIYFIIKSLRAVFKF